MTNCPDFASAPAAHRQALLDFYQRGVRPDSLSHVSRLLQHMGSGIDAQIDMLVDREEDLQLREWIARNLPVRVLGSGFEPWIRGEGVEGRIRRLVQVQRSVGGPSASFGRHEGTRMPQQVFRPRVGAPGTRFATLQQARDYEIGFVAAAQGLGLPVDVSIEMVQGWGDFRP